MTLHATPEAAPSPIHRDAPHESGLLHAIGAARYVDDLPEPPGTLHGWIVPSKAARGRIVRKDATAARAMAGVHAVLFAEDVPGHNHIGPVVQDEPVLAESTIGFHGQAVAVVFAETRDAARRAAEAVIVTVDVEEPVLDVKGAIARGEYLTTPHVIARGDIGAALAKADVRISGSLTTPAQDHFYLETQAALVIPEEDGTYLIYSSTQHPSEIQQETAAVLGIPASSVTCKVPRLGGGFGGKESQATPYAAMAALGAWRTGRPVKVRLDREQDMRWTGKRHAFVATYEAAFTAEGHLLGLDAHLWSDGGWSTDLSGPVLDRAMFHLDNAYRIPNLRFEGRACRTNLPSATAFRGFGGPQGMLVIEDAMNRAAERLRMDPAEVRRKNLVEEGDTAPYGQVLTDVRIGRITDHLLESSDYAMRRADIEAWNAKSPNVKRGIGFQPIKFGISFTNGMLNQAGALVLVYTDGSVQLNHGGTEMGQGLHTKLRAVASHVLGVSTEVIRVMTTATDKVPNTSATAASSGSDLNGQAVRLACETVRERMRPVAAAMLACAPDEVAFSGGSARAEGRSVAFSEVAKRCWVERVSLSSTGYYATPGIGYDRAAGRGTPFFYYAYGAAVTEVEVDGRTGQHGVRRVDLLQDCGDSLVPSIDRGQVEGAYVQGLGWLTVEEVLYDEAGRVATHGPSTYKIPSCGDVPEDFRVELLPSAPQPGVIFGSKAVGEPPLMLAISVVTALRHAIAGFGGGPVALVLPATHENVLRAVEAAR